MSHSDPNLLYESEPWTMSKLVGKYLESCPEDSRNNIFAHVMSTFEILTITGSIY